MRDGPALALPLALSLSRICLSPSRSTPRCCARADGRRTVFAHRNIPRRRNALVFGCERRRTRGRWRLGLGLGLGLSLGPATQAHSQEGSSTSVGSRQAQAPAVAEPCRRRLVAAHSLGAAVVVFLAASGRVAARDATAARRVIVVSRAAASARDADACAASIARHVPGGCKHDSIIACCAEGIAQGVAVAIAIAVAR